MLQSFWWSKQPGMKGVHWLSWKRLSRRKCNGGLGFRDLQLEYCNASQSSVEAGQESKQFAGTGEDRGISITLAEAGKRLLGDGEG